MRSLAAGALALLFGGCLKVDAVRCENGAICKSDQACTELPVCKDASCEERPLCGPPELVSQCIDDANAYGGCTVAVANDGVCVDRICTTCTDDLAGCGSSAWNVMTLPDGLPSLRSIWVASKTFALAGGKQGTLVVYDGRSWLPMAPSPATTNEIARIFGTSTRDVYAVTDAGEVFHFDGTTWTDIGSQMPGSGGITAIHGTAPNDIYAVGVGATMLHYDGSAWTSIGPTSGPTPTLLAVTATSAGATAVGAGGAVLTWNGSTPTLTQPMPSPYTTDELIEVFAHGAKLVAVSNIVHGNDRLPILEGPGMPWTLSMVDTNSVVQEAVRCAADDYACGTGRIYHYDGTTWSLPAEAPANVSVLGVSRADGYVFAVAQGPAIWRRRDL